jgi:hypothetical protein
MGGSRSGPGGVFQRIQQQMQQQINQRNQQVQSMQAQLQAQQAAAAKAEAERQRQLKIQAEDDQAQAQQLGSVQQAQRSLSGLQTSQQLQDTQAAQRQSMATSGLGGGGGFDINSAKMQALGNVAGAGAVAALPYASGPAASGGAAPMGVPQGLIAANAQAGGTNAPQNRFALPQAQNLTFGGA